MVIAITWTHFENIIGQYLEHIQYRLGTKPITIKQPGLENSLGQCDILHVFVFKAFGITTLSSIRYCWIHYRYPCSRRRFDSLLHFCCKHIFHTIPSSRVQSTSKESEGCSQKVTPLVAEAHRESPNAHSSEYACTTKTR